jgi:hypothetical protein
VKVGALPSRCPPGLSSDQGQEPVFSRRTLLRSGVPKTVRKLGECVVDRESLRCVQHVAGNPVGERLLPDSMGTGARVLLVDRRQALGREPVGDTGQRWPEPAVDESHLAVTSLVLSTSGESVSEFSASKMA